MSLEDRLRNWSRYYRTYLVKQCCASLEGGYQSNWRQWVELKDIQSSAPIDWRDAELIESLWRKMLGTPKLILKYTYMSNFPSHIVCRKCHIKTWQLESELRKAHNLMQLMLDTRRDSATMFENSIRQWRDMTTATDRGFVSPKETESAG